jgi:hypothetical protein
MIKTLSLFSILFLSFTASAQVNPKLEQLTKDPKMAEMAAKADIYILGKKISSDSTANAKDAAIAHRKKKKCCSKKNPTNS